MKNTQSLLRNFALLARVGLRSLVAVLADELLKSHFTCYMLAVFKRSLKTYLFTHCFYP